MSKNKKKKDLDFIDEIFSKKRPGLTKEEQLEQIEAELKAENERLLQETRDDLWNHLHFID